MFTGGADAGAGIGYISVGAVRNRVFRLVIAGRLKRGFARHGWGDYLNPLRRDCVLRPSVYIETRKEIWERRACVMLTIESLISVLALYGTRPPTIHI